MKNKLDMLMNGLTIKTKNEYVHCIDCPYVINQAKDIFCLKLGGLVGLCGHCGEGVEDIMKKKNAQRPQKLNKYYRKKKYKQHLERLADTGRYFPCGAYRVDADGYWVDDPNQTVYIKREYRGRISSTLKKIGNRQVRRYKGYIPNNGGYKKVFDFWWELY